MHAFTVSDLLELNLPERAAEPALISASEHVSYGALAAAVERLAAALIGAGVQRGQRVGVHLPKSVDEVVATFAIARAGAVFVNINDRWTLGQLGYVIEDCGIEVLVTDFRRARALVSDPLHSRLRRVFVRGRRAPDGMTPLEALPEGTAPPCPAVGGDLAALLYTSGSTGLPKGVMLTHTNVVEGARSVARYLRNDASDRVLGLLPMSFDYGQSQVTTMFLVGGAVVLHSVMMPAEIVRAVQTHGVTGIAAVPPAWIPLVRALQESPVALPSLRYITNSGGKVPPDILDAFPVVFPGVDIYLMYGLTEAFRSTYLPPEQFADKRGAIGGAIPGVEVFVVDPERGLCGPDEVGELVHRGALVSRGYWGKPEATAERVRPCPALGDLIGDEPVVFSGDLVRRDEDGVLWFVGRRDGMIKTSGFRLSPTEVEDVVFASGIVSDVVAFGVPDDTLGERVHCAVSGRETPVDVEALGAWCRSAMPAYMVPHRFFVWESPMPRTSSGKLDRPTVIARAREVL